jgi:Glycosyltransferase family 92
MKRLVFLFLVISAPLWAQYELAICTIFQNEAPFLKEWMEFHKLQGVQHFYLYNNSSCDDFHAVLDPYIRNGEVTLIEWPYTYADGAHDEWIAIQSGAYRNCLAQHGHETDWLAVIDTDEFLFCPSGIKLTRFLKGYTKFGGVNVNWLMFGTSHVEDIPPGTLLIELLTCCLDPKDPQNLFFKSIIQPKHVVGCNRAHYFHYKKGQYAVNAKKRRVKQEGSRTKTILLDEIRINHYWTRTERYLREIKLPSHLKRKPQLSVESYLIEAEKYNQMSDTTILQFVGRLCQQVSSE